MLRACAPAVAPKPSEPGPYALLGARSPLPAELCSLNAYSWNNYSTRNNARAKHTVLSNAVCEGPLSVMIKIKKSHNIQFDKPESWSKFEGRQSLCLTLPAPHILGLPIGHLEACGFGFTPAPARRLDGLRIFAVEEEHQALIRGGSARHR